jgi:molecular chaperone DnaJ
MPRVNSGVRGNLHAHLEVSVPTKLDPRAVELLNSYRDHSGDIIELASATSTGTSSGLFSRLRNAFAGR